MGDIGFDLGTVIAAILGVAIGFVFGHMASRRSARTASDLALASAAPPALYRVDTLAIALEFDETGSGLFVRTESGIEPISDLQEVVVPYRFATTPQGHLDEPVVRSLTPNIAASWRPAKKDATSTEGTLLLTGPLVANVRSAGYEVTQRFTRGFFMTKEETIAAYKGSPMVREYLGVAAYVPTRFLQFTVRFPESHHRLSEGPTALAFVGETEFENETETRRLKPLLQVEPGRATLRLENPRRGVRYAIAWLAPSGQP